VENTIDDPSGDQSGSPAARDGEVTLPVSAGVVEDGMHRLRCDVDDRQTATGLGLLGLGGQFVDHQCRPSGEKSGCAVHPSSAPSVV